MASPNSSSTDPSRVPTPNRFISQATTAEDLLKSQTVGLVHLSDFRKRRAEVAEQKERQATDIHGGRFAPASLETGTGISDNDGSSGITTPKEQRPNKRKKILAKGKLSFGVDEEQEHENGTALISEASTPGLGDDSSSRLSPALSQEDASLIEKKRLGPNASLSIAPKAVTKPALLKEAQAREQLRKEFLLMQEAVKATEIVIPFVFYDGSNVPGGACKVKKGDHVWLLLDRSRKVGAELGVGGGEKSTSKRGWARVGVDDLLLVRGEIIIPHHYEIYYFIVNKVLGPNGKPLFDYASTTEPKAAKTLETEDDENYDPISLPDQLKAKSNVQATAADKGLEGFDDEPNYTKVVDRRWYERNKHIFPASVWKAYDPGNDYSKGVRTDAEGNAFFFS